MDVNQPIDRLNIEVTTNAEKAVDGLKKLQSTLVKLNNVTKKLTDVDTSRTAANINILTTSMLHLARACERVVNSGIASMLKDLSKINFNKINGFGTTNNKKTSKAQLPDVYTGTGSYSGYARGSFADPGEGRSGFSGTVPINTSSLFASFKKPQSIFEKLSKNVEKFYDSFEGHFNKIITSVLRITFYRVIRFLIKAITQATKEGIQAMYAYSDENGLKFADTMDNLNSTMNQMKASLGSAASEIIMLLEPLIVYFADKVMETSNKIAETTASFSNKDYWMKAVRVQSKYVDATQTATDKLKNAFLGIDEINQLGQKQQKLFDYEKVYFTDEQKDPNKIAANVLSILSFVSPAAWLGNVMVRGAQGIDYLIGKIQEGIDSNNESVKTAVNQLNSQTEKQQQSTVDVWSSKFEDAIGRQGDEISTAIYNALSSWSIQFDNENVGKVVTSSQNNMARRTSFGASVIMK